VRAAFEFLTESEKEMQVLLEEGKEKLKSEQLLYELALADHKTTSMDAKKLHVLRMTMAHMYRSHRLLMGTGGYQSEGEAYTHTAITPVRYTAACWNVFGQTLSAYPDASHFPARYLAVGVLNERGKGGAPALAWQNFNGGNYNGMPLSFICVGFPYVPEEYKPAMLWVWNRMAGVEESKPETLANLAEGKSLLHAIYAFVNYPLDPRTGQTTIKPVHPNESFPKTWQATDKGLFVFRNSWRDNRDIVLQVYANQLMSKGHGQPDAASLRLHGLGCDWTNDSPGKGDPYRWLQNVVFLPQDDPDRRASGRVTSWHAEKDGSGRVSINLDLVYKSTGGRGHDAVGIWPAETPEPGDISGLRAVAADFSGKCGAPALFVLVDKVAGGGERKWLWHLPGSRAGGTGASVKAAGNTFTINQGKASLRAVFVAPAKPAVEAPGSIMARHGAEAMNKLKKKKDKNFKADLEPTPVDIVATAQAGESFFVVLTMQEGPAPEVKVVKGTGLDSVVQLGGRQVRFDGEKAIIEDR
jgi:hypothetical protein